MVEGGVINARVEGECILHKRDRYCIIRVCEHSLPFKSVLNDLYLVQAKGGCSSQRGHFSRFSS